MEEFDRDTVIVLIDSITVSESGKYGRGTQALTINYKWVGHLNLEHEIKTVSENAEYNINTHALVSWQTPILRHC